MASLDLKVDLAATPGPHTKTTLVMRSLKSKFIQNTAAYRTAGTSAYSDEKIFAILGDFLQPDTTLSIESVSKSIDDLLPEDALSDETWSFGEICIEISEQIPYYHPSQIKLAQLLERLGQSTKLASQNTSKGKPVGYFRYQRLGESKRDHMNDPDPENFNAWVNYNAFLAHLEEFRIWKTDPTYAIWALREGLEEKHENGSLRDCHILAAAQWILWGGQCLFKQVLFPEPHDDLRPWAAGPLYGGKPLLTLDRWHFWSDSFAAIGKKHGVSEECRNVANKAMDIMVALEKGMKP